MIGSETIAELEEKLRLSKIVSNQHFNGMMQFQKENEELRREVAALNSSIQALIGAPDK